MMHIPEVARRILALRAELAETMTVTTRQQLAAMAEMAEVDVAELQRPAPCAACAALYARDLVAASTLYLTGKGPAPEALQPTAAHPDCTDARAHGKVEWLPMSEWSPAARRLFEGWRMLKDGTQRPIFQDRLKLRDMVNKSLGAYIDRSININANVGGPDLSPAAAARMPLADVFAALGVRRAAPVHDGDRTVLVDPSVPE
jgi:hypothetical protein